VAAPRFLADEMVGRLARYLRFVGCDTLYARGMTDVEILETSRRDQRVILTRDRALADRAERALLLTSVHLADQWKAVRAAYPQVPSEVGFQRCTECNGELRSYDPRLAETRPTGVPWDRVDRGLELFRCGVCGHLYWEGSHTSRMRTQLAHWTEESGP
jgi:uncharacterized protein